METRDCPPDDQLRAFTLGTVGGATLGRIADHVEGCPACGTTLGAFDGLTDPLMDRLHGLAEGQGRSTVPVPPRLLEAALAARPGEGRGEIPDRLGRFELLEELGIGSYGHVFRAFDTELGRVVAVKVLRAGRLADAEDLERFLREARSTAQLEHPGIVALYETGRAEDGTPFLVEEFIPGPTLARLLREVPPTPHRAAELVADLADALDYAHRRGVVHRDVTPANILVDAGGRPHLMDFGLARREAEERPLTLDGEVLGTPAYMSPEQARGESRRVDPRSDVYGLGVVLYELLTGERPFRGNRRMLLLQVLEDEPRPPRRLNDKVPRALETICLKAMAKTPARRYQGAGELADDLRRFLGGEAIRARPAGFPERLGYWSRRNPVAASLFLAVTLGPACGLWHLTRLSGQLVRSTALEGAAHQSEMLERVNDFYSAEVVARAEAHGVPVAHDYASRPGAIPLPATMTIDLGERISAGGSGMRVRLYSDHPFRSRRDGGPRDDFERGALASLRRDPETPVYRFEEYWGRPSLRYATARRMGESCVRCHNAHPDSTKTDWRSGDVRGVLEIIRPLDRDVARTRAGLRGSFVLVATVSGALLLLSCVALLHGRRRRAGIGRGAPQGRARPARDPPPDNSRVPPL